MSVDIAVIDYGMGNLRSVSKAIEHVAPSASVAVTSDPAVIAAAGRVVFPGQGAAPDWRSLFPVFVLAVVLCLFGLRLFRRRAGEMVDEL